MPIYTAVQKIGFSKILNMKRHNYKPNSIKVGTLYKLWIKTECN